MPLPPGTRVDRYELLDPIGEGGQATVYRARHVQLGTIHALKVVNRTSAVQLSRLLAEGRAQATMRHRNVVNVTDVAQVEGGGMALVMEYVQGLPLDRLLEGRRLDTAQIDHLVNGILEGVAYAHRKGFVHRDLKPANILCALEDGELVPKIVDFGLVKSREDANELHRTRTGQLMGTALYIAPEQIRSTKSVDQRADLWTLGVILYELTTGRLPFEEEDMFVLFGRIAKGDYADPRELAPDLPERMAAAIRAALVTDPAERVATCERLLRIWNGESSTADTPPPQGRSAGGVWAGLGLDRIVPVQAAHTTLGATASDDGEGGALVAGGAPPAQSTFPASPRPVPVLAATAGPDGELAVARPVLDAGTLDVPPPTARGAGTLDLAEGIDAPPATAALTLPRRAWWAPVVVGLLGLGGLGAVAILLAWVAWLGANPAGRDAGDPAPAAVAPMDAPQPAAPALATPSPTPRDPSPVVVPEPAPVVVPEPAPVAGPTPAPAPRPSPVVKPAPVAPAPAPAPVVAPAPEPPVPAPAPAPAPAAAPPPAYATFAFKGDVTSAYLQAGDAQVFAGEPVSPGKWTLWFVDGSGSPRRAMDVTLKAGEHRTFICSNQSGACQ